MAARNDFADGPSSASIPAESGVALDDASPDAPGQPESRPDAPPANAPAAAQPSTDNPAARKPLSDAEIARRAVNRFKLAQQSGFPDDDAPESPEASTPGTESAGDDAADPAADESADDPASQTPDANAKDGKAAPTFTPDAALVARAKAVGLSDQHIADFGPDLSGIVSRREARTTPTPTPTPNATPATPAAPATPATDIHKALQELQDDGIDPKVVSTLRSIYEAQAQQVQALTNQFRAVDVQRLETEINSAFNQAPAIIRDLIGEGNTETLDPNSTQYQARAELIFEMNRMQAGYQAVGERVPPIRELLPRAAHAVFGERISKTAATKAVETVRDTRTKRFTQPPAARQPTPPKHGDARALATINAKLAQYRDS